MPTGNVGASTVVEPALYTISKSGFTTPTPVGEYWKLLPLHTAGGVKVFGIVGEAITSKGNTALFVQPLLLAAVV